MLEEHLLTMISVGALEACFPGESRGSYINDTMPSQCNWSNIQRRDTEDNIIIHKGDEGRESEVHTED